MAVISTAINLAKLVEVAFITLFAGLLIGRVVGKLASWMFREAELNRILEGAGFKPLSETLGSIVEYFIYFLTFVVILQQFGIAYVAFELFFVIFVVIILVAFVIAIRDVVPNVVAGFWVKKEISGCLGKKVRIGSVQGRLSKVGFLGCYVFDKGDHFVPYIYCSRKKVIRLQAK